MVTVCYFLLSPNPPQLPGTRSMLDIIYTVSESAAEVFHRHYLMAQWHRSVS